MRALNAAGAAAIAVAGMTAALIASSSGPPSALSVVTGALAGTSAQSYGFSLDNTVEFRGRDMNTAVVSGTVDPVRASGAELLTATGFESSTTKAQIRFIGRYVYTMTSPGSGLGKPWNKAPVPTQETGGAQGSDVYRYVSDQMVSPAELSGVLRYARIVRTAGPASSAGWAGTKYTFTGPLSGGSISGTVCVDQQGRVRQIDTTAIQGRLAIRTDLALGDCGAQPEVTPPPADQVSYTSYPYWGRYF